MIDRSVQKASNQTKSFNLVTKEDSTWEKVINGIIRPPRSQYKQSALGPRNFILNETKYERKEVEVMHQGKKLLLMTYQPQHKREWIILYLHGNSSSRLQATSLLRYLPFRFSLASFDFIGCGANQEGDTISLGVREAQQVQTIVNYLTIQKWRVVLWGRSMGAATALKYGKAPIIIADSSFRSFRGLCKQTAKQKSPRYVPNCLVDCFFPCIYSRLRSDIKERGGYDIDELEIAKDVRRISKQTMVIFMNGDEDRLIDKTNSEKLYKCFQGPKKYLEIFNGTHNTKRPVQTIRKVMRYIVQFIDEQITSNSNRNQIMDNQIRISIASQ